MLLLIFRGHQKTSVLHPEEIWGQRFHLDVLFSSKAAKFYWFILFCTFLASCFYLCKCSFEQNTRNLIVYLRNLSEKNNFFFFVFFIFKDIFSVPMFERYHFQSECNPRHFWRLLLTFNIFSGCLWKVVQSNLYNPTTLGTTQKWLSWTGGHHIKHLYKRTPNQEQKSNWLWHKYSKLNYLVVPFRMVYLVNQGSI